MLRQWVPSAKICQKPCKEGPDNYHSKAVLPRVSMHIIEHVDPWCLENCGAQKVYTRHVCSLVQLAHIHIRVICLLVCHIYMLYHSSRHVGLRAELLMAVTLCQNDKNTSFSLCCTYVTFTTDVFTLLNLDTLLSILYNFHVPILSTGCRTESSLPDAITLYICIYIV